MPGAVPEVLAMSGGLDDLPCGRVDLAVGDLASLPQRIAQQLDRRGLGTCYQLIDSQVALGRLAHEESARHIGVIAVDLRAEVE